MLKSYLKYLKKRVNAHGIHSPFVFEFYNEVIKKSGLQKQDKIEQLRKVLLKNNKVIAVKDLGAGSRKNTGQKRKIGEVTKNAATSKKYGELINRIITFNHLGNCLELGTSVGLGTAYMATANKNGLVTTIEGCPETAEIAKLNFETLGLTNVVCKVGEFTEQLEFIKKQRQVFDLIYIDGNHQKQATLDYFEFALNHSHDQSFILFDDIYWSEEMTEAWGIIKASDKINVSMDLFRLGIVCKREGQRKQDFILKF